MKAFTDKIAVVTGGGTGMGRELVRQLVAEGCNVAMCDLSAPAMAETRRLCEATRLPQGLRITTHLADVSDESQVQRFREEVAEQQATDRIHLLFNNAGVGGGGSMFADSREAWEKTFNICWGGVYLCTRAFLPMLQKADEAHIVNTSSVNGFWASVGPRISHTSYCAAKFAVKGFTEALITDLQVHAPHIKCSVVMPGHIGTSILANSRKIHSGNDSDALTRGRLHRRASVRQRQGWTSPPCRMRTSRRWRWSGQALHRGRADHRGRGRDHHPRWCEGGPMAHPGRQGCASDRRNGPAVARGGLRARLLPALRRRKRLAAWHSASAPAVAQSIAACTRLATRSSRAECHGSGAM